MNLVRLHFKTRRFISRKTDHPQKIVLVIIMATMQDDTCLLCHNEVHFNPTMKLMMAVCGHKLYDSFCLSPLLLILLLSCESCVTLTFLKATSLICPASDCHTSLRKNSLVLQVLFPSFFPP